MGFREQEGFIDEHDRRYGTPIPDHISAKWKDIELLIDALIATDQNLKRDHLFDAVYSCGTLFFWLCPYTSPFVDGNGRIHRYLIHHVFLRKGCVPEGIIFPVSAIILDREYKQNHF